MAYNVVLIGNEKETAEKIKNCLAREGIETRIVPDGKDLLSIVHGGRVDLIIAELRIPKEEGWSVFRDFKSDPQTKDIPVIFIAGEEERKEALNIFEIVAEDYISKPLDETELLARVRTRLRKAKEIRQIKSEFAHLQMLYEISSLPSITLNTRELSTRVLPIIREAFNASGAAIFLRDENEELYLAAIDGALSRDDIEKTCRVLTKVVVEGATPIFLVDAESDPRLSRLRLERREAFHNSAIIPLIIVGERVIGTLEIYNMAVRFMQEENRDRLLGACDQIALVLNLGLKYSQTQKKFKVAADELGILYEISDALSSTLNLDDLLKLIVRNAMQSFNAQVVSLMMVEKDTKELAIRCAEGLPEEIVRNARLKIGEGIAGRVAKTGQPLLLVDVLGLGRSEIEEDVKSAISVPLKIRDEVIGVLNVSKKSTYRFKESDLRLLFNLAGLAAQAIEKAALYHDIKKSLEELKVSYLSTVTSLSKAIEARDPYTQGHVERVARYGLAIAMELDPELLKEDIFRYALILHDIGKIGVPDSILTKPGPLSEEEMEIMKMHSEAGAQIISPVKFLERAIDIVRHHQERYDGKGYPTGLKGEKIPLVSRIIAVADTFDAMTSERPYRMPYSVEHTRDEITRNSGHQFDPEVVKAFLSALDKKLIP